MEKGIKEAHVVLGLGSNLGDRLHNLRQGTRLLEEKVDDMRCSSVYESDPVGVVDQPSFLNLALCGTTKLSPLQLLSFVKGIEGLVGRKPTYRWGPRILDIDILLYGQEAIASDELTVPHKELLNRSFAVIPLCEIDSSLRLPDGRRICAEAHRLEGLQPLRRLPPGQ